MQGQSAVVIYGNVWAERLTVRVGAEAARRLEGHANARVLHRANASTASERT